MRKRLESGAVDPITRVLSVKSQDGVARVNAHRLAIGKSDWEESRRQRHTALAKRANAPVVTQDPATRRPLQLPIYITRYRSSIRHWPQVLELVERLNLLLEPAQIVLQLAEPGDCNRSVNSKRCPFEEDIDHLYEWVHLAMVSKLPEDQPVVMTCGRCCLVADRCDDLSIARALAQLLGREVGPDFQLSEDDIQWMRWQVWLLQGQAVPLPLITVGVWGYSQQHTSLRKRAELREMLEHANQIWQQAGICWELLAWCPLQADDLSREDWQAICQEEPETRALEAVVQYGPRAHHVVCLKNPEASWRIFADPNLKVILLPDALKVDSVRTLAQALGKLLGLPDVVGHDQLMCPFSQGLRLGALEVTRARVATGLAADRTLEQCTHEFLLDALDAPSLLPELEVEVNLFLVRGCAQAARQSMAEAEQAWSVVEAIWKQAGIQLRVHLAESRLHDISRATVTKAPGYNPEKLNLFVVYQLPVEGKPGLVQPHLSWPAGKLMMVAESFAGQSKEKLLAMALAVAWGLRANPQAPFFELMNSRSAGLRLNAEEIQAARRGQSAPAPARTSQPETEALKIPVQLLLGCPEPEARALLYKTNHFWSRAGICWEVVACHALSDPNLVLQHPAFNPYQVQVVLGYPEHEKCWRERRLLISGPSLEQSLAQFLNLKLSGASLNTQEIGRARSQAANLQEVLQAQPALGPLAPLSISLALHLVRNPNFGTQLHLEDVAPILEEAAAIWQQAGIQLQDKGCQELALADSALMAALPSESGDRGRKPSFAPLTASPGYKIGSLNVYLLSKVTSAQGGQRFLSVQDKPSRIILMRDQDATLARTLASFLELPPNDFSSPESLRGQGEGVTLLPLEIEKAREEVKRLFPAFSFPLKLGVSGFPGCGDSGIA